MIESSSPIAQLLGEAPVAVDVGVEMAELPEQRALGLGVARVELRMIQPKGQGSFCFCMCHSQFLIPNSLLIMDPSLDGIVFSGCGHGYLLQRMIVFLVRQKLNSPTADISNSTAALTQRVPSWLTPCAASGTFGAAPARLPVRV